MMKSSTDVRAGLDAFYEAFNIGDVNRFGDRISKEEGVSVIGTAPGEGHGDRAGWLGAYEEGIAEAGIKLEAGEGSSAYEDGDMGFALDTPSFVFPDGGRLPTRLTAVLRREDDAWKVVHLHFSVGVPDEQALEMGASG